MSNKACRRIHNCTCTICQQHPYSKIAKQHHAINRVVAMLDEKNRRRFVGVLALQWGRGSILPLSRITGLSRNTIRRGCQELEHPPRGNSSRQRRAGGGRPRVEKNSPAC
jgi:hypothetical protein